MKVKLVNILDSRKELQDMVRSWRNSDSVKKYMFNDHTISEEEHCRWIESLRGSQRSISFIIIADKSPVGLVSIVNINPNHLTAEWGFYIYDTSMRGKGIGSLVLYKILEYAFDVLNIEKLNCEALENNPDVIRLYKKFGFLEEGIRRKMILKNGVRLDVVALGMLKEEWYANRNSLRKSLSN